MNHRIANLNSHQGRPFIPFFKELTVILGEVDLERSGALDDHTMGAIGEADVDYVELVDLDVIDSDIGLGFMLDGN